MSGREQQPDSSSSHATGDEPTGVRGTISSFAAGFRQYLEARGELLSIESREAARFAARQGTLGMVLAVACLIAYLLLLVAAISLVGHWLTMILPGEWSQFGWQTAAAAAALLHLGLAAACYRALHRHSDQPLFEITRSEFQKDRQWLHDRQTGTEKHN